MKKQITGYPVRCPECESWSFTYKSDRTGNIRCYVCSRCDAKYVAIWLGNPIKSCVNEPKNTVMEQWNWRKVFNKRLEGDILDKDGAIDVEFEVMDFDSRNGMEKLLVEKT